MIKTKTMHTFANLNIMLTRTPTWTDADANDGLEKWWKIYQVFLVPLRPGFHQFLIQTKRLRDKYFIFWLILKAVWYTDFIDWLIFTELRATLKENAHQIIHTPDGKQLVSPCPAELGYTMYFQTVKI